MEAALLDTLRDIPGPGELGRANGATNCGPRARSCAVDEIVEQVIDPSNSPVLAKYAFTLAQAFNAFYHRAPILNGRALTMCGGWARGGQSIYLRISSEPRST
jgi:hypothetical protein